MKTTWQQVEELKQETQKLEQEGQKRKTYEWKGKRHRRRYNTGSITSNTRAEGRIMYALLNRVGDWGELEQQRASTEDGRGKQKVQAIYLVGIGRHDVARDRERGSRRPRA